MQLWQGFKDGGPPLVDNSILAAVNGKNIEGLKNINKINKIGTRRK